jgi:hypothetical protein
MLDARHILLAPDGSTAPLGRAAPNEYDLADLMVRLDGRMAWVVRISGSLYSTHRPCVQLVHTFGDLFPAELEPAFDAAWARARKVGA